MVLNIHNKIKKLPKKLQKIVTKERLIFFRQEKKFSVKVMNRLR
jgi:hypothetical protein